MKSEVLCGDCREVMATMPADSIDAIVCDPPYGISFMQRNWDYGVPGPEFWKAALRVAKPGAYLLAFGGTRMFHRLMVAIEDAGWEIRDTISGELIVYRWIQGQGFPKSLNASKAIDAEMFKRWLQANPEQAARRKKLLKWAKGRTQKRKWTKSIERAFRAMAGTERKVIGFGRGVAGENLNDIVKGREVRTFDDEGGRGAGAYGVGAKQVPTEIPVTAAATDEAADAEGYGTALRPSWEPIVLARKPLIGTVAANILEHGTGALNIDAARIASGGTHGSTDSAGQGKGYAGTEGHGIYRGVGGLVEPPNPAGRWPPNVVFTHTPECRRLGTRRVASDGHYPASRPAGGIGNDGHDGQDDLDESYTDGESVEAWDCVDGCPVRALDEQSLADGMLPAGFARGGSGCQTGNNQSMFAGDHPGNGTRYGDVGGASRFFYCAKADRAEREHGLHGREARNVNDGRKTSIDNPFQRGDTQRRNVHPTVKPVDLMRWLVRLVCPKSVVEWRCERCENVPGVQRAVSASAERSDSVLAGVPESSRGTRRQGQEDGGLRDMRDGLPSARPAVSVLFDQVQGDGETKAVGNVSVREQFQASQADPAKLFDEVRGDGEKGSDGEAVRGMSGDLSAEEGRRPEVLLEGMRGEVERQGEAQGTCADQEGVRDAVPARSSNGDEGRLCDGASHRDGGASRTDVDDGRSGSPQAAERGRERKGRQPHREPSVDGEGSARRASQDEAQRSHVSPLPRTDSDIKCCSECGGDLVMVRRPGLVLDHFCGSGTTGIACKHEGMDFIGIDLVQEHVDISRKRIAQAAVDLGEATVKEADEIGGVVQLGLFAAG